MGNRANACPASFQAFVLILESKVIFFFFLNGELAAGEFEASLYLNKQANEKRDWERDREGRKANAVWIGVASWNSVVWVKQQVRLDGHKEPLLDWRAINFWSRVQASQHCNSIVIWRGERVKPPYPLAASPTAWACLVSVMWEAVRRSWTDYSSFHRSKITSAVW